MTLADLAGGERAVVREILGGRELRRRLGSLGVHPGDMVEVIGPGLFGGPVLVGVHGAEVAIGRQQATRIEVEPLAPR